MEQIISEINVMDKRIQRIKAQVALPTTDADIKEQMTQFMLAAEIESFQLQSGLKELDAQRLQLAEFFCEDPSTFKLEECFKVFQVFCDRFKAAAAENDRRRVQEEQSTLRRKHREEQLARKSRLSECCAQPISRFLWYYLINCCLGIVNHVCSEFSRNARFGFGQQSDGHEHV